MPVHIDYPGLYGRRWHKARRTFLLSHTRCVHCERKGRHRKATVVDHIEPHRGDLDLFWNIDNWQALCQKCHSAKSGAEKRGRPRKAKPVRYGVNGWPTDPDHHINTGIVRQRKSQ